MNTMAELIRELPTPIEERLDAIPAEVPEGSIAAHLPDLARFLEAAAVCYAKVSYDGSGSSEEWRWKFVDAPQRVVALDLPSALKEGGERFFREVLEARYPNWSAEQGGCGEFRWDILCDHLTHVHHHRYIDFETTCHRGL